jgi:hypothetical protein
MVKNQQSIIQQQDYYQDDTSRKIGDFFMGFGMCYGITLVLGVICSLLGYLIIFIISKNPGNPLRIFNIGILWIPNIGGLIASIIISVGIYKKYFKTRRFVKMGMITGAVILILIPLLLLGACFIAFSNLNM